MQCHVDPTDLGHATSSAAPAGPAARKGVWQQVVNFSGERGASWGTSASAPVSRVAVESTGCGLAYCPLDDSTPARGGDEASHAELEGPLAKPPLLHQLTSRLTYLPSTLFPPGGDWLGGGVVAEILRDERATLVRHVVIRRKGMFPAELEWWLRRTDSAVPIALEFVNLEEDVVLPADSIAGGICSLSVTDWLHSGGRLDIARNLTALEHLRTDLHARLGPLCSHTLGW